LRGRRWLQGWAVRPRHGHIRIYSPPRRRARRHVGVIQTRCVAPVPSLSGARLELACSSDDGGEREPNNPHEGVAFPDRGHRPWDGWWLRWNVTRGRLYLAITNFLVQGFQPATKGKQKSGRAMLELSVITMHQTFVEKLNSAGIEGVRATYRPTMAYDTGTESICEVVVVAATAEALPTGSELDCWIP
jgi:hypothetical protein